MAFFILLSQDMEESLLSLCYWWQLQKPSRRMVEMMEVGVVATDFSSIILLIPSCDLTGVKKANSSA